MGPESAIRDVAVVGGGPAGLAAAIACAQVGLSTVVLEKRRDDLDKACGEGLLPPALAALERLGVRWHLARSDAEPFRRLRYILADGASAEARLPGSGGLGVRRTTLIRALRGRAVELAVDLREGALVSGFRSVEGGLELVPADGGGGEGLGRNRLRCRLLIGADGLSSAVRIAAGLERPPASSRRYGLRQHFGIAPWDSAVEVYFGDGVEAYVTPVGPETVGVAFLWSHRANPTRVSAESLLARLPRLRSRLGSAQACSRPRGAGPLERRVRGRTADRVVLIGDAAGYLDAITGEGLSLAFQAALRLAEIAPAAIGSSASRAALAGYERSYAVAYRRYLRLTRLVLGLSARSWTRRLAVRWLAAHPQAFESLVAWGLRD